MEADPFYMKMLFDEDDGSELDPTKVKAGIEREMQFMADLDVGELVDRPQGGKVWPCRWCLRNKGDEVRCRYVVRQHREGSAGSDPAFRAGVPGHVAVRVLLAIALVFDLFAATGDYSVAFMHTPLEETIYVEAPPQIGAGWQKVWRLKKALYGLRVAALAFQKFLSSILVSMGFAQSRVSPSMFYHEEQNVRLAVHVDGPLCVGPKLLVENVFKEIGKRVTVKAIEAWSLGKDVKFLGVVYMRTARGFVEKVVPGYLENLAKWLGVDKSKSVSTPGVVQRDLKDWETEALGPDEHSMFRAIVGKVQWIVRVRPDVLYATKELSKRLVSPRVADMSAAKRLVKYLFHSRHLGLHLQATRGPMVLRTVSDSDWAGCRETRYSTSGYMAWLNGVLVSSTCKTQTVIALSSGEAEYYAVSGAMAEGK